jgi:hypothetical protein
LLAHYGIEGRQFRAESAVDTKDLVIDNRRNWQHIEHATAPGPDNGVAVLLLALIVETILMRNWREVGMKVKPIRISKIYLDESHDCLEEV